MPLVKRRFFVPCTGETCLKLYELVKDHIPSLSYISIEITSKGLLIEAYGHETDVKDAWYEIRRILGPLREATRTGRYKKYTTSLLARMIHRTLPPRLLVEALKRKGFEAKYIEEEDAIYTTADLDIVRELADKVASLNIEAGRYAYNSSTRYFLVLVAIITGSSIVESIEKAVNRGLLEEREDSRFALKMDWRNAIEEFLKQENIQ